jgi:hypothetical protein
MVSAFVLREFGFGYYISLEDLEKVNKKREGTHYSDQDVAKKSSFRAVCIAHPTFEETTQLPVLAVCLRHIRVLFRR